MIEEESIAIEIETQVATVVVLDAELLIDGGTKDLFKSNFESKVKEYFSKIERTQCVNQALKVDILNMINIFINKYY